MSILTVEMARFPFRKAIVTGAAGLLGHQLCERLASTVEVHGIVHRVPEQAVAGVIYHQIDLAGDWSADLLPTGADLVVHLAQSNAFRDFPRQAMDVFGVNVQSTARLLDYSYTNSVSRFVLASSGGVYGGGSYAFHENSPIQSHDALGYYLGSKLSAEILTQAYSGIMNVSVLRFFFMYGARQRRSMLIPRLVDSVREGRPIVLQGENGIVINPVHVDDAVAALIAGAGYPGSHTFNVAGADTLSLRAIVEIIAQRVGREPVFTSAEGTPHNLVGDIAAIGATHWTPSVPFHLGIETVL